MIKSLSIINFMAIEKAEIELTAPLNFLAGQNEAGKSSIRDALLWGFTGEARGLKTHQQQAALIREGTKATEVSIYMIDGHAFTRRKTQKTSAAVLGDIPDIGLNPAILFDPYTFLLLPEGDRRELFFKVIPGLNPTEQNVFDRLSCWPAITDIAERAEDADERIVPIIRSIAKMAASHGFPGAEKEAVMKRREAKRVRDEYKGATEPEKTITIDGKEYDIPTLNLPAIEATLKDLQAEKDDLLRQKGAGESRAKRLATIKGQLEKIGTLPLPPADDFIQLLRQDLAGNKYALEVNAEEIKQATVQEQFFPATCPAITLEPMVCPKAGIRVGNTPPEPGVIESLIQNRQGLIKTGDEITAKLSEAHKLVEDHQSAMPRKTALEEELAKLESEPEAGVDLDAEIAQRQQRIDRGWVFKKAAYDYDIALDIYKAKQEKLAAAEQEVIIYDALQKALAPDGIPSQMIAEALDGINELLDEAATYLFPGRYLHLTGDLSIVLQNSPYVTLSKSAKYRVGVAFQYALARLVGSRILLIDEMDILDFIHQVAFTNFLLAHINDFDQIMVFLTRGKAASMCNDPRAQSWWLENGKITKVAA
jgi:hypothetical protein